MVNSSPQEWAPLSYPCTERHRQSHDYSTTTKSNPEEPPLPLQLTTTIVSTLRRRAPIWKRGGKVGAVSRYQTAFMAARFRIAWLQPNRLSQRNKNDLGRVSGDFLPKHVEQIFASERATTLCVSFECDSLSEELEKKNQDERNELYFYFFVLQIGDFAAIPFTVSITCWRAPFFPRMV